jgi:hypothetical protein
MSAPYDIDVLEARAKRSVSDAWDDFYVNPAVVLAVIGDLREAQQERDAFRSMIVDRLDWQAQFKAPCQFCGYNGPGFYQSEIHNCVSAIGFVTHLQAERDVLLKRIEKLQYYTKGYRDTHGCEKGDICDLCKGVDRFLAADDARAKQPTDR